MRGSGRAALCVAAVALLVAGCGGGSSGGGGGRTWYFYITGDQLSTSTPSTLTVKVVDRNTGLPLAGVTVFASTTSTTDVTDVNGMATIPGVTGPADVTAAYAVGDQLLTYAGAWGTSLGFGFTVRSGVNRTVTGTVDFTGASTTAAILTSVDTGDSSDTVTTSGGAYAVEVPNNVVYAIAALLLEETSTTSIETTDVIALTGQPGLTSNAIQDFAFAGNVLNALTGGQVTLPGGAITADAQLNVGVRAVIPGQEDVLGLGLSIFSDSGLTRSYSVDYLPIGGASLVLGIGATDTATSTGYAYESSYFAPVPTTAPTVTLRDVPMIDTSTTTLADLETATTTLEWSNNGAIPTGQGLWLTTFYNDTQDTTWTIINVDSVTEVTLPTLPTTLQTALGYDDGDGIDISLQGIYIPGFTVDFGDFRFDPKNTSEQYHVEVAVDGAEW